MNRTTMDIWVGIFVVLAIAALMFLSVRVTSQSTAGSSGASYQLTAQFDNIGGLKSRAPVKSAGVVVGRVSNITFDQKTFRAQVTLTLSDQYRFPDDTIASILTSGLLGEQYVGLDAGGSEEDFKNGDVIKMTQSAVVLEKLISQFLFNKASEPQQNKDGAQAH